MISTSFTHFSPDHFARVCGHNNSVSSSPEVPFTQNGSGALGLKQHPVYQTPEYAKVYVCIKSNLAYASFFHCFVSPLHCSFDS